MSRESADILRKGYYYTEKDIVEQIRLNVLRGDMNKEMKTIECQIMDIADDIAYSTYDLEDAFKAGFLSPLGILSSEPRFIEKVAEKVNEKMGDRSVDGREVRIVLGKTYQVIFDEDALKETIHSARENGITDEVALTNLAVRFGSAHAFDLSKRTCANGYFRTNHTSSLVGNFMAGVRVEKVNSEFPALTEVKLESEIQKQVEILKRYTYCAVIESPRLKIAEFRGYDIVREIFDTLIDDKRKGYNLLPEDYQQLYDGFQEEALKKRVICDFIAGMTDQYAVEFYARLKSENPQTIFKPF